MNSLAGQRVKRTEQFLSLELKDDDRCNPSFLTPTCLRRGTGEDRSAPVTGGLGGWGVGEGGTGGLGGWGVGEGGLGGWGVGGLGRGDWA